ncbi:MAG: type II secretion system F family protein [Planctomycetaceae bacterium]|nr:type II secretion system F family protein [Planctomycetales bacterium]MCB9875548.1 type II secretion system F family protein [Planctomycetaceae bacterium]MCB9938319.1 type II secretion system F family protein [Planctomycetaceae bacterium]
MVASVSNSKRLAGKAAQNASGKGAMFGPKVKTAELVDMTSQMAIMTRAGVDIASALESLVRQCSSPVLKTILEDVHENVLGGKSVSESMSQYSHVFDETYVASIAAGEASGRLPDVLSQLAELLRSDMKLRNSVRTMLAYPILLSSVSGIVLLALILFVLPKFAEIFSDFDAPLPAITQVLITVSSELRTRLWLWGPLVFSCFAGGYAFKRSEKGRLTWDHFSLNAPAISKVTRALLIGRVCRLLGIMIDSGVPLLDSLRLARSSVKNSLYKELFTELEDDVMNGRGLATALLESEFVPASAGEMMVTAEKTGSLGMVTRMIGQHYEEEGEAKLREFVAFLEPVITVVMGLLVAIIVMSVMLPLFDLSSVAKG